MHSGTDGGRRKEEWRSAYDQSCALAKSCAEQSVWGPVARFALEAALRSHRQLDLAKETQWTFLALAYLRICALSPSQQTTESSVEVETVLKGLESAAVQTEGA